MVAFPAATAVRVPSEATVATFVSPLVHVAFSAATPESSRARRVTVSPTVIPRMPGTTVSALATAVRVTSAEAEALFPAPSVNCIITRLTPGRRFAVQLTLPDEIVAIAPLQVALAAPERASPTDAVTETLAFVVVVGFAG